MHVASSSLPHHSLIHATFLPNREMNEWKTVVYGEWRETESAKERIFIHTACYCHIIFITIHCKTPFVPHRLFSYTFFCITFSAAFCLLVELKIRREIEFMIWLSVVFRLHKYSLSACGLLCKGALIYIFDMRCFEQIKQTRDSESI